jgi:predicted nucleotidyltransferase
MVKERRRFKIKVDDKVFSITSNSLRKAIIRSVLKYLKNIKSIPYDMELRIQILEKKPI